MNSEYLRIYRLSRDRSYYDKLEREKLALTQQLQGIERIQERLMEQITKLQGEGR